MRVCGETRAVRIRSSRSCLTHDDVDVNDDDDDDDDPVRRAVVSGTPSNTVNVSASVKGSSADVKSNRRQVVIATASSN